MSPPLFLGDPASVAAGREGRSLVLTGPEGRHAVTVRRIGVGETILVGDGAGRVLAATVEAVQRPDTITARITSVRQQRPADPRLVVVQALAKHDRGELAVELLTEVGVDEIVPWQAERAIAKWSGQGVSHGLQRWRATAAAAAKQSRRAWLPVVGDPAGASAVRDRVALADLAIVLHAQGAAPITDLAIPRTGTILVVVGPEGDISPTELEWLTAAGARTARLGPEILRTSSAGALACAVLSANCGRWSASSPFG